MPMQCRGGYHALAKDDRCFCAAKGWSRPCLSWVRLGHGGMTALSPFYRQLRTLVGDAGTAASCRFCCKSLFALAIKISFGCTDDFHVNMWGTSLSEEKLAGDPGNVNEATSIGGRRSDFFTAGKLAPGNFGLLQQYLPFADIELSATLRPDGP